MSYTTKARMARTKTQVRQENVTTLVNDLSIDLTDAFQLQRLAKSLHRSYENECNYGLTPRQETRERNLWAQVEEIAAKYSLHVQEQGDPRGWPIIIDREPIDEQRTSSYERVCPF